jgi:N-acetylmuramoyl-L-alanine amidase
MSYEIDAFKCKKLRNGDFWYLDGVKVPYVKSPNHSGIIKPKFLVIHFTAGSSAAGAINWFRRKESKASAHFVIDYDGKITQMVPTNKKAWHAGRSSWKGYKGLNSHSIGIEVVNPGPLEIIESGAAYRSHWGKIYHADKYPEIFEAKHRNGGRMKAWIPFTPEQVLSILDLGSALMSHYDLIEAVGHDMIAPRRKVDPGPCMSPHIYGFLNGREMDDEQILVINGTDSLNLRAEPSQNGEVIRAINQDEQMIDLGYTENGWVRVQVGELTGFVFGDYVEIL